MKKLKYLHQISPSAAPSPSPSTFYDNTALSPSPYYAATTEKSNQSSNAPSSKLPIDFSPTLIAMVVIVAAAFLVVTYLRVISHHVITPSLERFRRWRHRRRRRFIMASPSSFNTDNNNNNHFVSFPSSPSFDGNSLIHGLDESLIKTIPLSIYSKKINKNNKNNSAFLNKFSQNYYYNNNNNNLFDCAVCLLEFEESDYIRTLPICRHAFHVDCIDIWLRSHANCPLCRGGIFRHDVVAEQNRYSPSSPLPSQMLSPARFSLLMSARIRPDEDGILDGIMRDEITAAIDDDDTISNTRPVLLKRSYSFGFERNFPSERLVERGMMTSPCRYHNRGKRPSPFKSRVFSFRMKSPFVRRRSFFPFSESSSRYSGTGNSRRTKSITSPMFGTGLFSSSRMRCGDPEALLSPERFNRR